MGRAAHTTGDDLARDLAAAISAGELAPGTRLPSTAAMARSHGVTVHAMQGALARLHGRGLLTRTRRRGTFVAINAGAQVLGVAMRGNLLTDPWLRVYGLVLHHLARELAEAGFQVRLYPPADDGAPTALAEDLAAGRLRAVLALDRTADGVLPPGAEPVPVLGVPWPDYRAVAYLGARHLLAGGARRIAAMPPIPGDDAANRDFRAGLAQALAEAGRSEADADLLPGGNREAYGHQAVAGLAQLPEAWLIADDNAARGVVAALLLRGVRLPGGCRLVAHANRGIEVFPPLALTRLEVDPRAAAHAVVANLRARLSGGMLPVRTLTPVLVAGDT